MFQQDIDRFRREFLTIPDSSTQMRGKQDGYEALMKGEDMVISGARNKVQAAVSAVTPDSRLAAKQKKGQAPVEKK